MQTSFSAAQLADPATAASEAVIRKCVHCGFCTATCPTYVLLGDELDSPRGRIYLMKDMLEHDRAPSAEVVKHVDRCLSCFACMTTCPSDVNYMHLVDHARAYIERRYRRPWLDRLIRDLLAATLPYPGRFRLALALARLVRPAAPFLMKRAALRPFGAMLALAPETAVARAPAQAAPLSAGVQPVLQPEVRAATVRLLNRLGFEVAFAAGEACCGALVRHIGRDQASLEAARRNVDAWTRELEGDGVDAIVITASGCGTTIKDYGFMLAGDPAYAARAARVSALAKDVTELLAEVGLQANNRRRIRVAYHAACSLQHGQKVSAAPRQLLSAAGYEVLTPAEAHLCCGSAGVYNILQPVIAGRLGERKAEN
ncbi:MAG: glycolate oxidase subunit GlcF, partial [Caulobacterales bacterium]|nr:glycolate oxidase subunit GlcF [Caulobacterales bacterium]